MKWWRAAVFALLLGCDPGSRAETSSRAAGSSEAPASTSVASSSPSQVALVASSAATAEPGCPHGYRCGAPSPSASIDLVLVEKRAHRLYLVSGTDVVASYSVAIGPGGYGSKKYEGDKVTPTGSYTVTMKIDKTKWHTYLALDYPNEEDKKRYAELVARGEAPPGVGAGSGIAIHGRRADMPDVAHKLIDWTLGCVALDNGEIDQVAARVGKGTRVLIRD